jgi:hypothetical protein
VNPSREEIADRPLTAEEIALTIWLLQYGEAKAERFLEHVPRARVVGRCPCGCASIDFAIAGQRAPACTGLDVLSDYQWRGSQGELFGVFVFARGNLLSGLEVWSIDGRATPTSLPNASELEPFGTPTT